MRGARAVGCLILMIVNLSSCSGPKELGPTTDRTGFLRNYALLRSGALTEPLYVYRNPEADLGRFRRILLEPIRIRRGEVSRTSGASKEAVQLVADHFYTLLHKEIAKHFRMVGEPGPETLRVRVAVTKLEEKDVTREIKSTDTPQPDLALQFEELMKTPPQFLGNTSLEVEFVDTVSNEVQYAAIERQGTIEAGGNLATWDDLETYLDFTVARIGYRLCAERGASGCVQPIDPFAPVEEES